MATEQRVEDFGQQIKFEQETLDHECVPACVVHYNLLVVVDCSLVATSNGWELSLPSRRF
jgi:hypothetical protein